MKSRDTLIRLKRFQLEEKRRRVGQIETMLAEFGRMIGDLDREIANEEKRAGITDPAHFAYPTYARATSVRRDNLKSSIAELLGQIEEAKAAQEEAEAEAPQIRDARSARQNQRSPGRSRGAGLILIRAVDEAQHPARHRSRWTRVSLYYRRTHAFSNASSTPLH